MVVMQLPTSAHSTHKLILQPTSCTHTCCDTYCRHKAWYPVAVLKDLDKQLPMHAQLLGMDLAIWWDSNTSQWRCAPPGHEG